jgi:hypothetical protein
MRVAKNRAEVENQIRNGAADLSLNEAVALLMLSSDVRKLLNFAKEAEGLSGEAFVDFCIANNVAVFKDESCNPFAGRSKAEQREWLAFILFLSCDLAAGRAGFKPEEAADHVEYLLQRPFQNVDEWMGPEGDEWRRRCGGQYQPTDGMRTAWAAFRNAHRNVTQDNLETEHRALCARFQKDMASGRLQSNERRSRSAR